VLFQSVSDVLIHNFNQYVMCRFTTQVYQTWCWYISCCSHNSWIITNDTKVTKYSTSYNNNHTVGTCKKNS